MIPETPGVNLNLMLSGPAALLAGLESGIRQIFNDLVSGSFFHFEANLKVDNSIKLTSFL